MNTLFLTKLGIYLFHKKEIIKWLLDNHSRNSRIRFDEGPHEYYIDNDKTNITSVTTFIHHMFPKFEADMIIERMRLNKNKWETGPYNGKSNEDIKKMWNDKGKTASSNGTRLHAIMESIMNLHIEKNKLEIGIS